MGGGRAARCPRCPSSFWATEVGLCSVRLSCSAWGDRRGRCRLPARSRQCGSAVGGLCGGRDIDGTPEAPSHTLPSPPPFSRPLGFPSACRKPQTPPARPARWSARRCGTPSCADVLNEGSTCGTQAEDQRGEGGEREGRRCKREDQQLCEYCVESNNYAVTACLISYGSLDHAMYCVEEVGCL